MSTRRYASACTWFKFKDTPERQFVETVIAARDNFNLVAKRIEREAALTAIGVRLDNDLAHRVQRHLVEVVVGEVLETVDMLNWHAFDQAIETGYRHTQKRLETLPESLRNGGISL